MAPQSRPAPTNPVPVLITRPAPQADRFAVAVQQRYGALADPVLTPLLAPVFIPFACSDRVARTLILTSETGARAAGQIAERLPRRAYCVGDQTARIAKSAGFDPVSANGDAESLLRLLSANPDDAPFLHLRGRDTTGEIVPRLTTLGISAEEVVIYAQDRQPLSAKAKRMLAATAPVVVPLFSPRTARIFVSEIESITVHSPLNIAALSPAIAAELAGLPKAAVRIAEQPLLAELFLAMDGFIISA